MPSVALIDWTDREPRNPGTPPWGVLAARLSGTTPTTHQAVFAAVDEPSDGVCRVVIAAEYGEAEAEVVTPFELDIRIYREGVSRFRLFGASVQEEIEVATSGSS